MLVKLIQLLSVILLLASLSGCTLPSHQAYLPPDGQVIEDVEKGDTVDVFMKDGTQHTFVVWGVDKVAIYGMSTHLLYSDIESVVVKGKEIKGPSSTVIPIKLF